MQPTSNTNRVADWFWQITFTTRWIAITCVSLYVIGLFYLADTSFWCLRPSLVVNSMQIWRIFTSPMLHGGIVHILMNTLALIKLGPPLERELFGSLQFFALNLLLIVSCGFLHCFVDFMAGWIGFGGWNGCSVGYSGVLFALITIHSHLSPNPFSFFGTKVPAAFYPWLLLISIQIFMPSVSFAGHLSGVLAAYCYIFNLTSWMLPTPRLLQSVESSANFIVDFIVNRPGYVLNPFLGLPSAPSGQSAPSVASNAFQTASSWFQRRNSSAPQTDLPIATIHTISSSPNPTTAQNNTEAPKVFPGKAHKLTDPTSTPTSPS